MSDSARCYNQVLRPQHMVAFVLFAALLSFGCAKSVIQFMDANDKPVTIEQRIGGRGCLAVSTNDEGEIEIIVQQDGSSDWGPVRTLPKIVDGVIAFFGGRPDSGPTPGPSDVQGCAGIFVGGDEDGEEEPE